MAEMSYAKKREKLVPKALIFADRAATDKRNTREGEQYSARWNRLFHAEMNRLAKEAGI